VDGLTALETIRTQTKEPAMSRRNGDRARFQKERKRKMLRRQRVQEFLKAERPAAAASAEPAKREKA